LIKSVLVIAIGATCLRDATAREVISVGQLLDALDLRLVRLEERAERKELARSGLGVDNRKALFPGLFQ
jgi:hypothetical protein